MNVLEKRNFNCEHIKELDENDVLFGRGIRISKFQGNIHFRKIVQNLLAEYMRTSKRGLKAELVKSVITKIKARNGRFLRKVAPSPDNCSRKNSPEDDCYWVVVEDIDLIMDKISQTFRDMACVARGSNNNNIPKHTASQELQFKSAIKKTLKKDTTKVSPAKVADLNHAPTWRGMDRVNDQANEGVQKRRLVKDKNTTGMRTASVRGDSEAAAVSSEVKLVVNPLQRDFDLQFDRLKSTLHGIEPVVLVHELEQARARVNQERQRLLMNQIEFQEALKIARLRQALLLPSLENQIIQQGFHSYHLQRAPLVATMRSQVNNPSLTSAQLSAFYPQANIQKISLSQTFQNDINKI